MSASQYIELLEQEVVRLRQAARLAAAAAPAARPVEPHTELLEYLKAQEAQGLQELTSGGWHGRHKLGMHRHGVVCAKCCWEGGLPDAETIV
jgi:hypothetical protein